jgi:hypothetical protein
MASEQSSDVQGKNGVVPANGELTTNPEKSDDTAAPQPSPSINGNDGTGSSAEDDSDSGEEAEDEDEDEEEDEDDDDDEEPALKYERIGGSLPDLLKKDSASALCISKSLLVLHPLPPLFWRLTATQGSGHARRHRAHSRPHRQQNQILQTTYGVYNRYCDGRDRRIRGHCFNRR